MDAPTHDKPTNNSTRHLRYRVPKYPKAKATKQTISKPPRRKCPECEVNNNFPDDRHAYTLIKVMLGDKKIDLGQFQVKNTLDTVENKPTASELREHGRYPYWQKQEFYNRLESEIFCFINRISLFRQLWEKGIDIVREITEVAYETATKEAKENYNFHAYTQWWSPDKHYPTPKHSYSCDTAYDTTLTITIDYTVQMPKTILPTQPNDDACGQMKTKAIRKWKTEQNLYKSNKTRDRQAKPVNITAFLHEGMYPPDARKTVGDTYKIHGINNIFLSLSKGLTNLQHDANDKAQNVLATQRNRTATPADEGAHH